jgi:hypothetical protein
VAAQALAAQAAVGAVGAQAMAAEGCDQPPHTAFADISEARPLSFLGLARTGTGLACQFSYRRAARIAASLLGAQPGSAVGRL